ncbi:MAG: HNH endonuclease signature motif containing protein [Oscillospiraceae bacterium]
MSGIKQRSWPRRRWCGICGKPVDKSLRYPHPLSPCIDHIIPVAKGGHPSDIDNLQLAHWTCNRQKSDKILKRHRKAEEDETISNRIFPQSCDWVACRSSWGAYRPPRAVSDLQPAYWEYFSLRSSRFENRFFKNVYV